jgi:hypothetical protein
MNAGRRFLLYDWVRFHPESPNSYLPKVQALVGERMKIIKYRHRIFGKTITYRYRVSHVETGIRFWVLDSDDIRVISAPPIEVNRQLFSSRMLVF